ncbi:hypothetical protein ACTFIR_010912 [Dictyostelium discoideum]
MTKLKVDDQAPDFSGIDQNGKNISLSQFNGKPLVLFFYPKDDSKSCTNEACEFRDKYSSFVNAGADVIGISNDDPESHANFISKNSLPYTLISDRDGEIAKKYGVHKELLFFPGRTTFILNKDHKIIGTHSSLINASSHIQESLKAIDHLKGGTPVH